MATVSWIAGKKGYVVIEDDNEREEYPFAEWQVAFHAEFLKRNNFISAGFQDGASGFKSAKLSVKGPWADGFAPISVGQTYRFYLGITEDGPIEYVVDAHVTDLTPSDTAEDGPMLDVSADSIGEFDYASL